MSFTRKIPGIRLPIPGRKDEAAPGFELILPGWTTAIIYAFLLASLGIYLFCTLCLGGHLSFFWLETRVLGFSLYAVASGVNCLLIVYALVTFLSMRREDSRRDWKRVAGFLFAIALLGCTQVFLNGWKNMARWDRHNSLARLQGHVELVEVIRAKIAGLGEHPWGGEYVSHDGGEEKRWLLAPDKSACQAFWLDCYSEEAPLHERSGGFHADSASVTIELGQLLLERSSWRGDIVYAVVAWGERRYLVEGGGVDEFLALEDEPANEDEVYLRLGDETRPLGGRPVLVEVLR